MSVLTLSEAVAGPHSVRAKALVFEDPRSEALLAKLQRIAPSSATVLITGETGTGKELVARHIHDLSRPGRPFLAVNCGTFSESLIESELFGHVKGAFTGAVDARAGWFESAHGGTLFLDEVGDLSPAAQVKLLRVLQENEVVRVGARTPTPIDVRIVVATNVRLEALVASGRFREDLYYRLKIAEVVLPPLRERQGDVLPLARYFLELYGRKLDRRGVVLSPEAERRLLEHTWPGNIRELENVVHHALLVSPADRVTEADLHLTPPPPRRAHSVESERSSRAADLQAVLLEVFEAGHAAVFQHVERALFRAAYAYCERNQLETARLLGISRNVVRARLIAYGELEGEPRSRAPRSRVEVHHARAHGDLKLRVL